jgi:hypothetical protein
MRKLKVFGVLAIAVFALTAIAAANASAAPKFTTTAAGGTLTGAKTTNQVFKINGGTTTCTGAATDGTIAASGSTTQEVTVTYSGCTAFGFVNTDISPATYLFSANGEVAIKNTITITPTGAGCTVTVGETSNQNLKSVSFDTGVVSGGFTGIEETSAVSGITYTSTGGLCGSSGTNGTYTGNSFLHGPTGVTISWDKE